MITLASMFRDATGYLERYFDQVAKLRASTDVRLVLAEGDSLDGTLDRLKAALGPDDTLLKVDHGGPSYGSVDAAERWQQISVVARAIIGAVGDPGDCFVWVEADLIWEPHAVAQLVEDAFLRPAVAPMVLSAGGAFYDVWGFRKDSQKFSAYSPFVPGGANGGLIKIDSCGSCFATTDWPSVHAWDGMWPYTAADGLWLDPAAIVRHP